MTVALPQPINVVAMPPIKVVALPPVNVTHTNGHHRADHDSFFSNQFFIYYLRFSLLIHILILVLWSFWTCFIHLLPI